MPNWIILKSKFALSLAASFSLLLISGCSDGGSSTPGPVVDNGGNGGADNGGNDQPTGTASAAFSTPQTTARFLTQATFGPTNEGITQLTGASAEDWLFNQFAATASLSLPYTLANISSGDIDFDVPFDERQLPTFAFWINTITGQDQLRQRMAFALSQIFVLSHDEGTGLEMIPEAIAYFQDILIANAFGNYRDILEEVTYSRAMAEYLTYYENQKGDPTTGRVPDENYAREILQLFSIGLVRLNPDGTPVTDSSNNPIETYTNQDITGLARVFTGLSADGGGFFDDYFNIGRDALYRRLRAYPSQHSDLEKTFLGQTIAAGTGPEESISQALDIIFNHPNVAPFVARQLIQRFVTSDPEPAYVGRVANAFATGTYTLPDGRVAGDGRRGSLQATIAAVLFDEEARSDAAMVRNDFGKIREPVLRFTHWARAFGASTVTPENTFRLFNTSFNTALAQGPYKAPSVFNFYRPGYVAPGTQTGAAGLTVPELQIVNASTLAGYTNFMTLFIDAFDTRFEAPPENTSFVPDYTDEMALIDDPAALVDHLNLLLTNGALSAEVRAGVIQTVEAFPITGEVVEPRITAAILLIMTSPDYLVQR